MQSNICAEPPNPCDDDMDPDDLYCWTCDDEASDEDCGNVKNGDYENCEIGVGFLMSQPESI